LFSCLRDEKGVAMSAAADVIRAKEQNFPFSWFRRKLDAGLAHNSRELVNKSEPFSHTTNLLAKKEKSECSTRLLVCCKHFFWEASKQEHARTSLAVSM
jgi:hypothetical protein